jgi:hypothetical protein
MMRRGYIYILFFIIALQLSVPLSAQTLTNQQRRNILEKVHTTIEEYERLASLSTDGDEYEFSQLFVENATIDSDIIGNISYLCSVTVDEYIKQVQSANVYTEIINVKKHELSYDDNRGWYIPIRFSKQLNYYDCNGVYFNIRNYYGETIDVCMNLLYNEEDDMCYIESIEVSCNSQKQFPQVPFLIIDNNRRSKYSRQDNKCFNMLKANNASLSFDENGYAIYSSDTKFTVDDFDITPKPKYDTERKTDSYNFVDFDFIRHFQRAKLKFAYAPFAYAVSGNETRIKDKSMAFDVGIDYGFTFSSSRKSKAGIFFGAGISFSNVTLELDKEINNTHKVPVFNTDDKKYEMKEYTYSIKSAMEQVSYIDLYVPLYFEIERMLGSVNRVVLSWNFGVKSYFNMSATSKIPYTATFKFSESATDIEKEFDSYIIPNTYAKNLIDLSATSNLGVDYNVVKNRLYINAAIGYEYGFWDSYVSDKPVYSKPIMPKVNKEDNSIDHVAVNSMISGLSLRRQALWISLGVKYKF